MKFILQNGAIIKDMEAATIAWVCQLYNTPMFALKAITDLIDDQAPPREQFLKNLQMVCLSLKTAVSPSWNISPICLHQVESISWLPLKRNSPEK